MDQSDDDKMDENQLKDCTPLFDPNLIDTRALILEKLLNVSLDFSGAENHSFLRFALSLECARHRVNEISLFDLFNGKLRYNEASFDPKKIKISIHSKHFLPLYSSKSSGFSAFVTMFTEIPKELIILFAGNNKGFDFYAKLKCQYEGNEKVKYIEILDQTKFSKFLKATPKATKIRTVEDSLQNSNELLGKPKDDCYF
jgi:hypothetical protein